MSSKIQILAENVINQIAAGEVIERPSSVVKELVENSLDAGAHEIRVAIEEGGKKLIRVCDDGIGMNAEDLQLCAQRHATSKLKTLDDLLRMSSNGFRGEAVASIASVSQMTIESKTEDDPVGIKGRWNGGRFEGTEPVARTRGTQIDICELFFNTPVRRNFLGSNATETSRIVDVFSRLAMANPQVRFELKQGSRILFQGTPGDFKSRLAETLGAKMAKCMVPVDYEDSGIKISGFIAPPTETKGRRSAQYFYVSQRPIWNPIVSKAVQRAYEPYGHSGYPIVVLFIELLGKDVDVNVHPAKREVRFANENQVFLILQRALRQTLMDSQGPKMVFLEETPEEQTRPIPYETSHSEKRILSNENPLYDISVSNKSKIQEPQQTYSTSSIWNRPAPQEEKSEPQDLFSLPEAGKVIPLPPKKVQTQPEKPIHRPGARYFQWAETYVICEDAQGLLILDQNAAHQRILYEEALQAMENSQGVSSQELLFPEMLELSQIDSLLLEKYSHDLMTLGFHVEPFGGTNWQLRGIPVHLPVGRSEDALRDFLQHLNAEDEEPHLIQNNLAKSYACGAAIQAGARLSVEEMTSLFERLMQTKESMLSPFGRPTLLQLTLEEMHRRFKRPFSAD